MISPDNMTHILGWMQAAGIRDLSVWEGNQHLRLQLDESPVTAEAPTTERHQITSPGQGRFLATHPRRPAAKVERGDQISAGQIVAYLKAGNTLTAITASIGGTVTQVWANDGDLLGYATPVLIIEGSTEPCTST